MPESKWQPKTSNVKTQNYHILLISSIYWVMYSSLCLGLLTQRFKHSQLLGASQHAIGCQLQLQHMLLSSNNFISRVNKLYAYSLRLVDWTSQLTLSCVPYQRLLMLTVNRLYPISGKRSPLFTLNNHALTCLSKQYTLTDHIVHNLSSQQEVTQLLNMHG